MAGSLDGAFHRLRAAVDGLPGIEPGSSYGTPALKVKRRLLARVKDSDTIVLSCPIEEKERLISAGPAIYHETEHYAGWPYVLIRLSKIGDAELSLRLTTAWRDIAPKALIMAHDAGRPASG